MRLEEALEFKLQDENVGNLSENLIARVQCYNKLHCVKSVRIRSYSGPYFFPAFGLNTERCGVSLRIQSKCGEKRTRITPNTDTFDAVLNPLRIYSLKFSKP